MKWSIQYVRKIFRKSKNATKLAIFIPRRNLRRVVNYVSKTMQQCKICQTKEKATQLKFFCFRQWKKKKTDEILNQMESFRYRRKIRRNADEKIDEKNSCLNTFIFFVQTQCFRWMVLQYVFYCFHTDKIQKNLNI